MRRSIVPTVAFVVTVLLLSTPRAAHALNAAISLSSGTHLIEVFQGFGFAQGGQVWMTSDVMQPIERIKFYMCTQAQWSNFVRSPEARLQSMLCSPTYPSGCEIDGIVVNSTMLDGYAVATSDYYRFMLINCIGYQGLTLRYTLLNPGDKQLGVGEQPIPAIYLCMIVAWHMLLFWWTIDWILQRVARSEEAKATFTLHFLVWLVIILKLGLVAVSFMYWNQLRISGYRSEWLMMAEGIMVAASESMLFLVLALAAKGWKITRTSLPDDVRPFTIVLLLLLSSLLIFSLYTDGYYFLSLTILYFFVVPKIFASSNQNSSVVDAQILMLQEQLRANPPNNNNNDEAAANQVAVSALSAKSRLFRSLRATVVVYFLIVLAVSILKAVIPYNLRYISYAINEFCMFALLGAVAMVLRPNQSGVFSDVPINEEQRSRLEELFHDRMFFERFQEYVRNRTAASYVAVEDLSKMMVVEYPSQVAAASSQVCNIPMVVAYAIDSDSESLHETDI